MIMSDTSLPNSTDRYDAIVQAAQQLFAERGYQSVSTEEIAKTAGVSKGLVHYHFGSKEELVVRILENGQGILTEVLDAIAQSPNTAREKVKAAIKAYLEMASSGPGLARIALTSFFETADIPRIRSIMLKSLEEQLLKFVALIDEGIANGEFRPVDSRLTTHFVIGMAFEVLRVITVQHQPMNAEKIADEVTGILIDGIGRT